MNELPILIAGAGIGGLTTAIALSQRGASCLVFERAPALREAGAGITVQTNAMVVMDALGLAERLTAAGLALRVGDIKGSDGSVLQHMDLSTTAALGPAGVAIHRQRLLEILAEACPAEVRLGAAVSGLTQQDDRVVVQLESGEEVEGAALIGCDGLRSRVRATLHGAEQLRYAGYTTWRGIARGVAVDTVGTTEIWGAGERFGIVPISADEVYWFAVAECPAGGRDEGDVLHALSQRFAGWPTDVHAMLGATTDVLRTDTFDRPRIDRWTEGRVTLLGDAAHPMTPNLGQGAGQAIEDAWALADAVATHPDDLPRALQSYAACRRDRANWFVDQSFRMGQLAQLRNPVVRALRNVAFKITPQATMAKSLRRMYTPVPDPRAA